MPRKRKPLTEWQRQAKNFKERIRYSEKKGYRVSEHARYTLEHIKEYTAEELKGFTHEYIREIDSISEAQLILENYRQFLKEFITPGKKYESQGAYLLLAWFNSLLDTRSVRQVAEMIKRGLEEDGLPDYSVKYREHEALAYIGKMQAWLPEDMRLTDEQIYRYANDYDSIDWGEFYDY